LPQAFEDVTPCVAHGKRVLRAARTRHATLLPRYVRDARVTAVPTPPSLRASAGREQRALAQRISVLERHQQRRNQSMAYGCA